METLSYNYFAYGSNMNFLQMEQRCPGARFQGRGILPNYRFHLYSRGYASVMKYEGQLFGVAYGGFQVLILHSIAMKELQKIATTKEYRHLSCRSNGSEDVLECEIYFGSDSQDGTVEARDGY